MQEKAQQVIVLWYAIKPAAAIQDTPKSGHRNTLDIKLCFQILIHMYNILGQHMKVNQLGHLSIQDTFGGLQGVQITHAGSTVYISI